MRSPFYSLMLHVLYFMCSCLVIKALVLGHYSLYDNVRSCSTINHVTADVALLGHASTATSMECLLRCEQQVHCGYVVYSARDQVCTYFDKDFLACDEDTGIMTKVKSNTCANGGTLVDETLCLCTADYTGPFCDVDIHRGDDCEDVTCQNGGTCQDLFNDYLCLCNYQYTGTHCESHICSTVDCYNGGSCSATDENDSHYMCDCVTGYTGTNCETDVCSAVSCENYGTCVHTTSTASMWVCDCVAGFSSTYCTTNNGPVLGASLYASGSYTPGSWSNSVICATGTYFGGFRIKADTSNGFITDDYGVTEIDFYCYRPSGTSSVRSGSADPNVFNGGAWQSETLCPAGYFITRFRQYAQPDMGWAGDSTGTNNIEVDCRGPGMSGGTNSVQTGSGASFPDAYWTAWSGTCPSGWAVCYVQVKVEGNLGISDVMMRCCEY